MTHTDIVKALGYFAANLPDDDEDWKSSHLVEFALEMVRQHNEEIQGMLPPSWARVVAEAKP